MEDNKNKNNSNPICSMNNYRNIVFECFKNLKWLDNLPKGMEEVDYNYQDDDDDDIKKINIDDYKFEFGNDIKLNSNHETTAIKRLVKGKKKCIIIPLSQCKILKN